MEDIRCPISGKLIRAPVSGPSGSESRFLSEFEEIRIINSGGFGCVVECVNKLDKQSYAVKKVVLGGEGEHRLDFDFVIGEVLSLAKFSHGNVVRYYQAWFEKELVGYYQMDGGEKPSENSQETQPCLYIQQELCPDSLDKILPLQDVGVWKVFKQIVLGLNSIHTKGIFHGDLKPSNIFLDHGNEVKIGDFGLASCLEGNVRAAIAEGIYVAPELKEAEPKITLKADIYSLGIILCEMLFGFNTEQEKYTVLVDSVTREEFLENFRMDDRTKKFLQSLISQNIDTRPFTEVILEFLDNGDESPSEEPLENADESVSGEPRGRVGQKEDHISDLVEDV